MGARGSPAPEASPKPRCACLAGRPDAGLVLPWERRSCHGSEWGISQRGDDAAQRARAPTWAPGGLPSEGAGEWTAVCQAPSPTQNLTALALHPGRPQTGAGWLQFGEINLFQSGDRGGLQTLNDVGPAGDHSGRLGRTGTLHAVWWEPSLATWRVPPCGRPGSSLSVHLTGTPHPGSAEQVFPGATRGVTITRTTRPTSRARPRQAPRHVGHGAPDVLCTSPL